MAADRRRVAEKMKSAPDAGHLPSEPPLRLISQSARLSEIITLVLGQPAHAACTLSRALELRQFCQADLESSR